VQSVLTSGLPAKDFPRQTIAVVDWFWHTSVMAYLSARSVDCVVARGRTALLSLVGLATLGSGVLLFGQQETVASEEPIHTLHVYVNLIQIPTLVLDSRWRRLKAPIPESRFSISIDNGPWFRATHVRQEGNDAISLSILLDVAGDSAKLMPKIADAIGGLAPLGLHERDNVSVYAMDCGLVRSINDVPAENAHLKLGVTEVLESWRIRQNAIPVQHCEQTVHLWDSLAFVVSELSKLPGRRVILVVSDGNDKGSRHRWNEVRAFAESKAVAVFGVSYSPSESTIVSAPEIRRWSSEDPFRQLCELSGGVVSVSSPSLLTFSLERFVTMVRERYIVEFPRPANATSGNHYKEVRISKGSYFIRTAGTSFPPPDATVLADPTTVPSDPSLTPERGKRKPMDKPQ
jgi:hypothetical protein